MVLPHGVIVAWLQGNSLWPMFLFGFAGILLITQLHGVPVGRWGKRALYGTFLLSVLAVYGGTERGLGRLDEIVRIPVIEYALILVIYLVFLLLFWILRGIRRMRNPAPSSAMSRG